jgi:hypothetical protein
LLITLDEGDFISNMDTEGGAFCAGYEAQETKKVREQEFEEK